MSGHGRAPEGLPRLLRAIPEQGAMSLDQHLVVHGEPPLPRTRRERRDARTLIEQIEHAGLLGHGGAAFPTAIKMRAVARARGRPIVLVNAAEGEPASFKDHTLLAILPHLVLDGALLAARAVGADEIVVCLPEDSRESVQRAVTELSPLAGSSPTMRLVSVPDRYVAGQESALVNYLGGAPAIPTFTPPLPSERGISRRPTLVHNAETFAHIALIARHGPEWFRRLGTAREPGSTLVTLSGPVAHPGVYEIEHGASLSSLIGAAGGGTAPIRAGLFGGYAGAWIGSEHNAELALSNEQLAPHGASLGAGVVLLLSENACGVAETARAARWLADQSTGQCGPCVHGLDAIATSIEEIAVGTADPAAEQRIAQFASLADRRGACSHPDGAVRFILSALDVFGEELADHAEHGLCDACHRAAELPLPEGARVTAVPA